MDSNENLANENIIVGEAFRHFMAIASLLNQDEKARIFYFLKKILLYGLRNGVENVFFTNGKNVALYCEGVESQVTIKPEIKEIVNSETDYPWTFIHNHPNSTAFSYNDYSVFLNYIFVKNMFVCGHNGNLYFLQKGVLFYNESPQSEVRVFIDEFLVKIEKMQLAWTKHYCEMHNYTIETLTSSCTEIQLKCVKFVMDNLFDEICKELLNYDFRFYREGE